MVNLYIIFFSFFTFQPMESSLEVKISNVTAAKGTLRIGFYQDHHKFPGDDGYLFKEISIDQSGPVTFNISLPAGKYAMSVYHDLNDDKELNTNLVGIPKEPYGFSIARGTFGPPSFKDASFSVPETSSITVEIK